MMKVLIVDDQESVRVELREYLFQLKMLPKQIYEASNIADAQSAISSEYIDVVFLDIVLGNDDGFQLLSYIRKNHSGVAVIIMTGYSEMKYTLRAIEMHADGFLLKPINLQKLQNILTDISQKHSEDNHDYETRQLYYQLFEAYVHDQCLDVDFSVISSKIGITDMMKDKIAVFQIRCPITEDLGKRIMKLNAMLKNRLHDCIVYSPRLSVIIILVSTDQQDSCIEYVQNCLQDCISFYTAGCAVRSHSYGISNVYRMAEYILKIATEMDIHEKIFMMNPTQVRKQIVHESALRIMRVRDNADRLRIIVCDLLDRINSLSLPIQGLEEDFAENGLLINFSSESNYSSLRMRAQLMEALIENKTRTISDKVLQMITFMENHYAENITLAMAANAANMNYTYSSMIFKQELGVSFTEYLTAIRIEKAKALLLSTNCYTYEISQKVGFANDKYFIRQFKTSCGITPQEFRRKMVNKNICE